MISPSPAAAQTIDKSQYHLFNPTPRELWRDLSADRPDITESPITVDAGAVQLEMSFIEWSKDGRDRTLLIAPLNFKIGVLNNVDVQLVLDPYVRTRIAGETFEGFGDTQIRVKINLWGNDGGATALALLPFIKFPTASNEIGNDEYEGGVAVPFALELADNLQLGLMLEADFVYDELDDSYDTELLHTITLAHDLTEKLGAFVEAVGIISTDADVDYRALMSLGGTYALNPNLALDAGINLGLHGAVDDLVLFAGMTVRF